MNSLLRRPGEGRARAQRFSGSPRQNLCGRVAPTLRSNCLGATMRHGPFTVVTPIEKDPGTNCWTRCLMAAEDQAQNELAPSVRLASGESACALLWVTAVTPFQIRNS